MHLRPGSSSAFLAAGVLAAVAPADPTSSSPSRRNRSRHGPRGRRTSSWLRGRARCCHAGRSPPCCGWAGPPTSSSSCTIPTDRALAVEIHDATPPSMGREPTRHHVSIEAGGWSRLRRLDPPGTSRPRLDRAAHDPDGRTAGARRAGSRPSADRRGEGLSRRSAGRAEVELRFRRAQLLQSGLRSTAYRGGATSSTRSASIGPTTSSGGSTGRRPRGRRDRSPTSIARSTTSRW